MPFIGAKLALFHRGRVLTCLRDDIPQIPFPGYWDLPGGGAEPGETPSECALRELQEEFGLILSPSRLEGRSFPSGQGGHVAWFFRGKVSAAEIAAIRFGDEGQCWQMMPIAAFLSHPKAVPHFKDRLRLALQPDWVAG